MEYDTPEVRQVLRAAGAFVGGPYLMYASWGRTEMRNVFYVGLSMFVLDLGLFWVGRRHNKKLLNVR